MNLKQIPIIGTPISISDLAQALKAPFSGSAMRERFTKDLQDFFNCPHCHLVSSGRTAAYVILKVLSSLSGRKEVVIPAYVCASVVGAIKKAGLKVKLCDISLDTFQIEMNELRRAVSENTLCIMPAHLFGLPCRIEAIDLIARESNCYVVEDFAQSMGTVVNKRESGTLSSIAFTSFGRGKNLPTYSGGAIVLFEEVLFDRINEQIKRLRYPSPVERAATLMRLMIFALIVNPYVHKAFHKLILKMKGEDYPILDLKAGQYAEFQAGVGDSILKKFNALRERRYKNGMYLYERLKNFDFLRLPHILEGSRPAFNRFPVLLHKRWMRKRVEYHMQKAGIVACRLYTKPIHRLYPDLWDGKEPDPFSSASFFAENSVTLPTHPLIDEATMDKIIEVFKQI
ncbi:DegT/DnrJ/EryC1/StrS family aminotransferase [Candidatus Omnitrophota bacterium]